MLQQTVENAYQLFAVYKATLPLDVCIAGCCMEPQEAALLARLPVQEIPNDLLRLYTNGAATDKTPIEEVKHFLPRYLHFISTFNFPSHSAEITLQRLAPYSPNDYTAEEWDMMTQFRDQFFDACLLIHPLPDGDQIDCMLILFWKAGIDIYPLLANWAKNTTLTSVLHYADLVLHGFSGKKSNKMSNTFADEALADQLHTWAYDAATKQVFATAIEQLILNNQYKTEDNLMNLEAAYNIVQNG